MLRTITAKKFQRSFSLSLAQWNINPAAAKYRFHNTKEGYYWQSSYEPITVPDLMLDDYFWKNVKKWENKIAIACGVTGRKYTYAKLRDHCAKLAVLLQTHYKLNKGDIVAICLPNIPEYPLVLMAAIEAGLVVTTINPKYTIDEVARQIKMCDAKLIFGLAEHHQDLKGVSKMCERPIEVISVKTKKSQLIPEGAVNLDELLQIKDINYRLLNNRDRNTSDVCLLPYSSGTTGLPKGVMLTHANITSNCEMLDAKMPDKRLIIPTTKDYQDVVPSVLPFFHLYGLVICLISKMALGCKIVSLPHFNIDSFLGTLVEHKATFLNLIPHIIIVWAQHERATIKHAEHVRAAMSAAAPLGALDYQRFKEKAPHVELLQGYGLTETSPFATITPNGSQNYASIGCIASNTEAKIVRVDDPTYSGVNVDEVGELFLRGPLTMKGYLNNKEATRNMILSDGWLRTGDLACYDCDGHFYIKDRLKELIKVKGFQVPPAELEEIIRDHPQVLDAAVIGVPHEMNGEAPKAFVVRQKDSTLTEAELQSYVARKVIAYKRLTGGVKFLDAIPKTDSGKYLRRLLRDL